MSNLATVQTIYAAFGRGDIATVLATLDDDVTWEYQPVHTDVPWLQARRGVMGAGEFFSAVNTELAITHFGVKTLAEAPGLVIALIEIDFTVKRTGKAVREVDEVHLWHFDERGRVVRFRHVSDTHQHHLAWHA